VNVAKSAKEKSSGRFLGSFTQWCWGRGQK